METNIRQLGNHGLGFLTDDNLRRVAPSIFANEPMPGASERYQFVRTIDVVNTMREAGYQPVKAGQATTRNPDGSQYVQHIVRMMHRDYLKPENRQAGDTVPQVLLRNSHNRTSAFHLSAGLYRLVCSNGLAVSSAGFVGVRVLHNDPAIHDHIIDGTGLIREVTANVITPQIEAMQRLELTEARCRELAEAATFLKWGAVRPEHVEPLLQARREEDAHRNLWAVLNRIQENVVKGGYEAKDSVGRTVTAKPLQSIARDLDFNLELWTLGAKVLELA